MSNLRGRPKGPEKKAKTSIYVSDKMTLAVGALVGYRKQKSFSGALEYAVVEMAKQAIRECGCENNSYYKPLFDK
ncbi:MAG: DUF1998 domain-containing protein [Fibrobacter sp.]|nr:DUF1998 domain-containing protein [Fibrobacter sp.]